MNIRKDIKVEGKHGRPVTIDSYHIKSNERLPLIILAHGFKGFKDWGHWELIAKSFATAGFFFVKFNFSYNGTTTDAPTEFGDLEAFGQNNYTKELSDIDTVLEWLYTNNDGQCDLDNVSLIGHSRGGGVSIIKAGNDQRIHQLITWASVEKLGFASYHPAMLKEWKEKGVWYILNGRTKQQMPLYYQLHEDVLTNKDFLDVEKTSRDFEKPWLLIHGREDKAVSLDAAHALKKWNPSIRMEIIEGANHVFGGRHPYISDELPEHSRQLVALTIDFLRKK